ncbi:MAG: hypothetical protein GY913_05080 [Proteobacteria bacterium]|nr:hypothetical protein [Pseudomonadota bacterium]
MLMMILACTATDDDSNSDPSLVDEDRITETGAELIGGDLFDPTGVHRIDITLSAEDAELMRVDLNDRIGEFGSEEGGQGGGPPGGGGGGPASDLYDGDPVWVEATLAYDGDVWEHIGMRFKGNSSLNHTWLAGNNKLPFRLNLDKFEDTYEDTKNQRFQDHDKLTFSSGYADDSQIREAFTAEALAWHGIPTVKWSFVEVWVDSGDGPLYWGLYTVLQDPSDDVWLEEHFGTDALNVYKPESDWQTFDAAEFEKKTNEDEADFSDVEDAVAALAAGSVEDHVDVPAFLQWLAFNTALENWDVYGAVAHNYYLVADPDTGLLVWVPWDHNMAMNDNFMPSPGIWHEGTTDEWPLITELLDDPKWSELYGQEVANAMVGPLELDEAEARMSEMHALIETSVGAETSDYQTISGADEFDGSVDDLIAHLASRHEVVEDAL